MVVSEIPIIIIVVFAVFLCLCGVFGFVILIVYVFQGLIYMYFPPKRQKYYQITKDNWESKKFVSEKDRVKLSFYLIKNSSKITIIYFHGNGSDVLVDYPFIENISTMLNYNVIYMDYRGYGNSGGYPNQKNIVRDTIQFLKEIAKNKYFPNSKYFILGSSLGGAVVFHVLHEIMNNENIVGVIIQNTFTSTIDMIKHKLPLCSSELMKFFIVEKWENVNMIKNFNDRIQNNNIIIPLLFLSSSHDKMVPQKMMQDLYSKYNGKNKGIVFFDGDGHNSIFKNELYFKTIREFVNTTIKNYS